MLAQAATGPSWLATFPPLAWSRRPCGQDCSPVSGKATPPPWIDADWWHRLTNPLKPQAFRNGFDHRTEEYVMGEARRRMRVAAIGAEISWSDDRLKAAIRQPKFITIGEPEDMARAYMADDPVTFVPAKALCWNAKNNSSATVRPCLSWSRFIPTRASRECFTKCARRRCSTRWPRSTTDRRQRGRRFDAPRQGRPPRPRRFRNQFRQSSTDSWSIKSFFIMAIVRHVYRMRREATPLRTIDQIFRSRPCKPRTAHFFDCRQPA
jgi:hypothetical protein